MKRILVPTDFSPTAEKAFRLAVDIAGKAKGTVILYHNLIPAESSFIGNDSIRKEYSLQNEGNIVKRMQRLRKKVIGDTTDVSVSTIVGRSPLIDNMLGFAEHNHIDIIVMGTQGAGGLKKTIIGSVAARVIERADLPVLLVPSKYELEKPGQFVFVTNYQATDKEALRIIDGLAHLYNADITVLHLLIAYETENEKERRKKDFDAYAVALQKEFSGTNMSFHLLEISSVIETMETLENKIPYDVMGMVRRRKTFLEKIFVKSFTQNMAYITKKLLLIVPEKE